MDAAVGGKLRVKGCGQNVSLLDQNGEAVTFGENFDPRSDFRNARRADVHELHWAAFELRLCFFDHAVDLASVGVALNGCVEHSEALLRRIHHLFCQQNTAGAGAEGGTGPDEGLQTIEEAVALEKLEKRRRFTAGNDQTV